MNIIIDARLILKKTTGIGNYLTHLIENILTIDDWNSYTLLLKNELNGNLSFKGRNLSWKPIGINGVGLKQHLVLPWLLRKEAIDIYHYPHFDLPYLQTNKSVITIHDLKYIIAPHFFPEFSGVKKFYMEFFIKSSVKKAKKIIAVSESTKKDLVEYFHVSPGKIVVIPLAVDHGFRKKEDSETVARKLAEQRISTKYFLFVGERRPHKNIVRIIEAFHIFRERSAEKYKLVIIGDRYSSYSLPERKIEELKLDEDVILTGYVPENLLHLYYQGATALVFPSLYEGFGIPILEAMAYGIPVITSNLSSMPEVAGDAALLVDPYRCDEIAGAMERIGTDAELRKKLIARGSLRVQEFSWKRTAEKTLSVYEEVYSNGAKRQG